MWLYHHTGFHGREYSNKLLTQSQYCQTKNYKSDHIIYSSETVLIYDVFRRLLLKKVPGDGHNILHAIAECLNTKKTDSSQPPIDSSLLCKKLATFTFTYQGCLKNFIDCGTNYSSASLMKELIEFIRFQKISSSFSDCIPYILAQALKLEIKVYEKVNDFEFKISSINHAYLPTVNLLRNAHGYDALLKIDNPTVSTIASTTTETQERSSKTNIAPLLSKPSNHVSQQSNPSKESKANKKNKSNELGSVIDFRVVGLNTNGLRGIKKRNKILLRTRCQGDVILLQETHTTIDIEKEFTDKYKDKFIFSHGTAKRKGVMIIFKNCLEHEISKVIKDDDGRYLIVVCTIQGQRFLLVNAYAPNDESENSLFLNNLSIEIFKISNESYDYIVCEGDWNFTENLNFDRTGGNPHVWKKSIHEINKIKCDLDLLDCWRIYHPDDRKYTWKSISRGIFSRLDRFYISETLQPILASSEILPSICSDHSTVFIHLKSRPLQKGPGLWRLNTSLLDNATIIEGIKNVINEAKNNELSDKRNIFDYIKFKVKEYCITESKKIAKLNRNEISSLETLISETEKKLLGDPTNETLKSDLYDAQNSLEKHYGRIQQGLIIQSHIQYYEDGEKCSKFFLNSAKQNAEKTVIRQLKTSENSSTISDQNEILDEIRTFYQKLFNTRRLEKFTPGEEPTTWINALKERGLIPVLSEEDIEFLKSDFTIEDLEVELKYCKNNRSPGNDGLPYEFYKHFWQEIKEPLFNSWQEVIKEGEMSASQKQSHIKLIPKKDKDGRFLKNKRPLNQCNTDVRQYSKYLATKFLHVISKLIHPSQLAYIRGRFIGEGIRIIEGIIEYVMENKLTGILLAIDFEKAFDSLEWDFIWLTLEAYGFPEVFIDKVKLLYKNIEVCVMNGGSSTGFFRVFRGLKQGCPVSGILFILAIALLSTKIRHEKDIKGITVKDTEIKATEFADDINNFLSDIRSVKLALREYEVFGRVSGLVCNLSKCQAMALGTTQPQPLLYNNEEIEWVDELTITGIIFGKSNEQLREKNFETVIDKLQSKLNIWKQRDLSLIGKMQILKTFGISQIQYIMNMITPTPNVIKTVKQILNNFLWGSNVNKIKHTAMIANYNEGGLKMPDLEQIMYTQRIIWLKRFLNDSENVWKTFMHWQLDKIGGTMIFQNSQIAILDIQKKKMLSFYESIITAWALFFKDTEDQKTPIIAHPLYFNSMITNPKGTSLYYPDLIKKGICYVNDVVSNGQLVPPLTMKRVKHLNGNEFFHYLSLYSCIRSNKTMTTLLVSAPINLILPNPSAKIATENSKSIYNKLVKCIVETPSSESKLVEHYQIDKNKLKKIYQLPFCVTIESKMRAFQFKINHLIYYTNEKLAEKNMIDHDTCTFCQRNTESLTHLFIDCPFTEKLWIELERITEYKFNNSEKLFGCFTSLSEQHFNVISHCTILLKYYVHICRIKNTVPSVQIFRKRILYSQFLESEIAKKRNKIELHDSKWMTTLEKF